MNEHTLGPWYWCPDDREARDGIFEKDGEHWRQIAMVDTYHRSWQTNARLIVAAPELLEALRIAEGIVHHAVDQGRPVEAHLALIRAVIAKATEPEPEPEPEQVREQEVFDLYERQIARDGR